MARRGDKRAGWSQRWPHMRHTPILHEPVPLRLELMRCSELSLLLALIECRTFDIQCCHVACDTFLRFVVSPPARSSQLPDRVDEMTTFSAASLAAIWAYL